MHSLAEKSVLNSLIGTLYLDILPPEDEDEEDDEPGVEFLDPGAWEGPPSRLLAELLEQDRSDEEEMPEGSILHYILRKDTLRVLMETGEFMAILDQIMAEGPTGVKEDARWPCSSPIYIELTEASPELPEEFRGFVHSYIITEDFGDDTKGVIFPNSLKDGPGTTGVMINTKTGEISGLFGSEGKLDLAIKLARGLVTFVTDVNYEFVEMPLNRRARRRLQRSGQPNPWHVVRCRKGPPAP